MKSKNILLFTDLDGSLLNKKTFDFKAALSLIKDCLNNGIKIIANSSKTNLELDDFCKTLNIPKIYISENGSCIYGLNLIKKNLNKIICLSRNRKLIYEHFVNNVDLNLRKKCNILEDETLKKQIDILGLPKHKIEMALDRKFSIPFTFNGDKKEEIQLNAIVEKIGLKIQFGGRVLNLGDTVSKGKAMDKFISLLSMETKKEYLSICVGDNENDFDMLEKSDYPCLVKSDKVKLVNFKNDCVVSKKEAPYGWVEVVNATLNKILEKS